MALKDSYKKIKIVRNKDTGNAYERYKKSFFHAIDGFVYSFLFEHNIIIILIGALITTVMGFIFCISIPEWLFCIIIIGLILATELINTSIEALVDLVTKEMHPLAKIAKDTASTAVLILCVSALIGGLVIFVPKIFGLFI